MAKNSLHPIFLLFPVKFRRWSLHTSYSSIYIQDRYHRNFSGNSINIEVDVFLAEKIIFWGAETGLWLYLKTYWEIWESNWTLSIENYWILNFLSRPHLQNLIGNMRQFELEILEKKNQVFEVQKRIFGCISKNLENLIAPYQLKILRSSILSLVSIFKSHRK